MAVALFWVLLLMRLSQCQSGTRLNIVTLSNIIHKHDHVTDFYHIITISAPKQVCKMIKFVRNVTSKNTSRILVIIVLSSMTFLNKV